MRGGEGIMSFQPYQFYGPARPITRGVRARAGGGRRQSGPI